MGTLNIQGTVASMVRDPLSRGAQAKRKPASEADPSGPSWLAGFEYSA